MQTSSIDTPRRPTPAPGQHDDDVVTVIGPDGQANPATDPRLGVEMERRLYTAMVRTRIVDQQLERLQRQGRIGFHIGSLGEEACILGSVAAFREQDWIFPCYREFGALLWRGMPLQRYVDNMYGNANDPVKGRQMPDHYTGRPYRFGSVSSPIGTQITQAVGFGWAARLRRDPIAVGVYFGDGATSSNDFHTGMNFAGVFRAPVVFLLRNNRWAISVPVERQSASRTLADKGIAYGVRAVRCDGNDALATYAVVREAVERAARGEGPTLVEMLTYRLGGHSTSDDPRAYRAQDEVEAWRRTDPLVRMRRRLEALGAWSEADEQRWRAEVEAELRACIETAERTPPPALSSMFDDVYAQRPWHLREQAESCERGPRARAHGHGGGH
ncbi:MAG: thiamine pyrophosphate-dependent enzyme [Myxococcota bacterium]|nr:thiamine pyrophosphate-dependent enzyme [Myxococcota bacterium]MDW8362510.1 thiamine pyrophosphate-dependent enzyme [Myxococcales bacterium]